MNTSPMTPEEIAELKQHAWLFLRGAVKGAALVVTVFVILPWVFKLTAMILGTVLAIGLAILTPVCLLGWLFISRRPAVRG